MPLHTCTCSFSKQMRRDIQAKIDAGESLDRILEDLKQQYGPTVLSAPPRKGFFLSAWVLPFVAIVFGGGVIGVYLYRRRDRSAPPDETLPAPPPAPQEDVLNTDEILKRFDR